MFYFQFCYGYDSLEYTCSRSLLQKMLQRLEALDVPELSDANRAALYQFLQAARLL
jgi:hypothetical protein